MLHHTAHIRTDPITKTRTLHVDGSATYRDEVLAAFPDGPLLLTSERLPRKRSGPFNRYYFGTVLTHLLHALNDAGNDVAISDHNRNLLHQALRDGPLYPDPQPGKKNSTARLTDKQFQRYVRDIVGLAAEYLDYAIPAPPVYWSGETD